MQFYFINTASFLLQSLTERQTNKIINLEVTLSEGCFNLHEYNSITSKQIPIKDFETFDKLQDFITINYGSNNLLDFKELADKKLIAHKDYFFNKVLPLRNKRIYGGY